MLKKMDTSIAPPPRHTSAKADVKGKGLAASSLRRSELEPDSSEGTESDGGGSKSPSIQVSLLG